jgi:hypothetical protein
MILKIRECILYKFLSGVWEHGMLEGWSGVDDIFRASTTHLTTFNAIVRVS